MTKAKSIAATKSSPKPAAKPRPTPVDRHAAHVQLDSIAWNEAKGEAVPFRLCSCGARRAAEG